MSPRAPRQRSKWPRVATLVAVSSVACFALLEVTARALTRECHNGMPRIGRVPLLPLRPPAETIERSLDRGSASSYIVQDAELGWSIGPDGAGAADAGDLLYRSNHQGVRADPDRVFALDPPPGRIRIVTVGDSFTHGDEVAERDTWQRALESIDGRLEVLNLGVPGYGTDQALLRWRRDGRRFRPQLALLGIWPENMCRNLNLFRYYLVPGESFACKPRMLVRGDTLEVLHSPVSDREELVATLSDPEAHALLAHERWYREDETRPKLFESLRVLRFAESVLCLRERRRERARLYSGEDPEGIDITVAIAREFARDARAQGATPLVLLFPMRELLDEQSGRTPFPLVRALREQGLDVLDLGPAIAREVRARGAELLYTPQGHFTPEGNRVLAQELALQFTPWLDTAQR